MQPAVVALLDVGESERSDLRSPEAAQKNRKDESTPSVLLP